MNPIRWSCFFHGWCVAETNIGTEGTKRRMARHLPQRSFPPTKLGLHILLYQCTVLGDCGKDWGVLDSLMDPNSFWKHTFWLQQQYIECALWKGIFENVTDCVRLSAPSTNLALRECQHQPFIFLSGRSCASLAVEVVRGPWSCWAAGPSNMEALSFFVSKA